MCTLCGPYLQRPLQCYITCHFVDSYTLQYQSIVGTYGFTKNNPSGHFLTIYWIQTQYILFLGEQVLTIFLCIKRVRLNWNFIVNDVQSATYPSHGAHCPARDLFPKLNTRVKVHISLWTIREYPKRHFRYLSDSGDTFLPLIILHLKLNPNGGSNPGRQIHRSTL